LRHPDSDNDHSDQPVADQINSFPKDSTHDSQPDQGFGVAGGKPGQKSFPFNFGHGPILNKKLAFRQSVCEQFMHCSQIGVGGEEDQVISHMGAANGINRRGNGLVGFRALGIFCGDLIMNQEAGVLFRERRFEYPLGVMRFTGQQLHKVIHGQQCC